MERQKNPLAYASGIRRWVQREEVPSAAEGKGVRERRRAFSLRTKEKRERCRRGAGNLFFTFISAAVADLLRVVYLRVCARLTFPEAFFSSQKSPRVFSGLSRHAKGLRAKDATATY